MSLFNKLNPRNWGAVQWLLAVLVGVAVFAVFSNLTGCSLPAGCADTSTQTSDANVDVTSVTTSTSTIEAGESVSDVTTETATSTTTTTIDESTSSTSTPETSSTATTE